jgi:DNA polymerase-3 subunit alpha
MAVTKKFLRELDDWLLDNRILSEEPAGEEVVIEGFGKCFLFDNGEKPLFDEDLYFTNLETDELVTEGFSHIIFKWGNNFYYSPVSEEKIKFNILRNIGEVDLEFEHKDLYVNLGVRGKLEVLNGSGDYVEWAKKAKYFGMDALGICEKNTLAATMPLQLACEKVGIKHVFGITVDLMLAGSRHEVKVYAQTQKGWQNLLRIAKAVNVDNHTEKFISLRELILRSYGTSLVLGAGFPIRPLLERVLKAYFKKVYYQLDTTIYDADRLDKMQLENLRDYLQGWGSAHAIDPILLSDSYYIEKQEANTKKLLNKVATGSSHRNSSDQYFKTFEDHYDILEPLFEEGKKFNGLEFDDIIDLAAYNTVKIAKGAKAKIILGELHLPDYEMSFPEELQYGDQDTLFLHLVEEGFKRKVPAGKEQEYRDRLNYEYDVIRTKAAVATGHPRGFVDYFLILWDIIRFCKENGIQTGIGRGSAAGSVISYLLDITEADPIAYGLLFERFLNEKRIASGLPDIDCDFQSSRREDVKAYMEKKYGKDHVFSIGTFGSIKVKVALKDMARVYGVPVKVVNIISGMISDKEALTMSWAQLFEKALSNPKIKDFIKRYPQLIEGVRLVMGMVRNTGVHAAGVVITPKRNAQGEPMQCYDWVPVKIMDGLLVSEWDGPTLELAGFLKEDILATAALDKLQHIVNTIKETTGEEIDILQIDLKDPKTYELFALGRTQDVFQFNSVGMTKFISELRPDNIGDLTAANALYRPATMQIDAHTDYILYKHGEKEPVYDWGLREVTAETYGIMVYQEQMMEAVRVIGGFSLVDADGVRKAMGKKKADLMESYREQFIKGAQERSCDELIALSIWNKIEAGAGYGFNKSHAACYALTAYYGMWFKANYPVHFYTTALQFANDKDMAAIITEIQESGLAKIVPPDVNKSEFKFITDYNTGEIFWALTNIKMVGEVAVKGIMLEREKGGDFTSFEDFVQRMDQKGYSVNKTHIVNMILSGCFDRVEGLKSEQDRLLLIKVYYTEIRGEGIQDDKFPAEELDKKYWWIKRQIELCGLGVINYKSIYKQSKMAQKYKSIQYLDPEQLNDEKKVGGQFFVAGTLTEVRELNYKAKAGTFAKLTIQCNDKVYRVTVWGEDWETLRDSLKGAEGSIVVTNLKMVYDNFIGGNAFTSYKNTMFEII